MGSRLRGNDDWGAGRGRGWVPAFAGMTVGGRGVGGDGFPPPTARGHACTGMTVGGREGRIGGGKDDWTARGDEAGEGWVPAFAGMTVGGQRDDRTARGDGPTARGGGAREGMGSRPVSSTGQALRGNDDWGERGAPPVLVPAALLFWVLVVLSFLGSGLVILGFGWLSAAAGWLRPPRSMFARSFV